MKFTAGLFDFKTNSQIYFEHFNSGKTVYFSFTTGDNIGELYFLVYAGIVGFTAGKDMLIDSFEVYSS